jgi:lysine N6-hydroxylase
VPNVFFERKESFGWHDGQLAPGTTLQVSMVKDLVTLADPRNPFSFLAYLYAEGKIYHYLNAQFDAVPRSEFRNYMEWASRKNENLVFGEEVLSVDFDGTFTVRTNARTVTADNIVLGVGREPKLPLVPGAGSGEGQFHVCDLVDRARGLGGKRVWVVGGGQSGAEAFLDLISRPAGELPRRVGWITRRRNYYPLDDSPFTNDYYMPCYSEYFAGLPGATRDLLNHEHLLSSDGISEATLRAIYQQVYEHRFVNGASDLVALHPNRAVVQVTGDPVEGWCLSLVHNDHPGTVETVEADVIIWATGFASPRMDFLDPIAERLERDGAGADGEFKIDREFALRWNGPSNRNIFLQNGARRQRGLADSNLSLLAWRSQRIVDRLRGVRTDGQIESFLEWSPKLPAQPVQEV